MQDVHSFCTICEKISIAMRMTFLFLFFLVFQMQAEQSYSQTTKISLDMKNSSIEKILQTIEERSEFYFLYNSKLINVDRKTDIQAKNESIVSVLNRLFGMENVAYEVKGTQIILQPKEMNRIASALMANAQQQQKKQITGKITDEKGEPIIGANILEQNTTNGTITDTDGNFSLIVAEDATIRISYIGYLDQNILTSGRKTINIVLHEDTQVLDELIVVGYGVQKKSDLTGSITQVKMSDYESKQALSLGDYLRGAVAGLNIARSSSVKGQQTLSVRDQTSLSGKGSPLIVIDGMIYPGDLNDINPNDIESVSVMKDASSTAVYGANGANGVVLITTNSGKNEKPTIRFDLKTSFSRQYNLQETYDVDEYLKMRGDKLLTDKIPNSDKVEFFANPYKLKNIDLATWIGYDGVNPDSNPTEVWLNRLKLYPGEIANYNNRHSVNWLDEVLQTGYSIDYNTSVSGKSKNLSYYWSLGMLDNIGVVVGSKYKNIRSHINIVNDITNFLQVGIRANLSSSNSGGRQADLSSAFDNSPLGDFMNEDGTYVRYPNTDNMAKNPLDKTQWDNCDRGLNMLGIVFTKLTLPYGFQIETNFNNMWKNRYYYQYKPSWTIDGMRDLGMAERDEYSEHVWSINNILRWNKSFNTIHKFDVTLLQSADRFRSNETIGGATEFIITEQLGHHNLGLGNIKSSNSNDEEDQKASYMGRLNYSFMDRYLITLSLRRDGDSRFGQDMPWASFPGMALAWRLSEEPFMQKIDYISNLKLRFSYGKNGNSNIGRYDAMSQLNNGYTIIDGQSIVTMYPIKMGNRLLQWESTLSTNIGLDLGLFNNRINVTADFFQRSTTNMLTNRALPTITGFTTVRSNLGEVKGKGFELATNTLNVSNSNFRWISDFTMSINRNKIEHLYGKIVNVLDENGNIIGQREADDPTNGYYIGHAIDEIYGYQIIGVWQKGEEEEAAMQGRIPGDYKTYMNAESTGLSIADYRWQGYTTPRCRMSLRNTMTFFRSLTLSFMLRSEFGHKKASNEIVVGGYADRISQIKYPYWTEENPSDYWGRLGAQKTGTLYRNASFLRIEDVSLSYELPQKLAPKISVQNTRIFFNVDNVYCFDTWKYWDVETKAPIPTTFTFGISLTL
jgi:TonB-linked SusC/RagA family outer membrane protein